MGKKHADEMLFWTKDEFQTFIESMKDRPASYAVFMTLYFTGIREGALLALTPSDIDFEKKALTVNKSYQRLGREDVITTPKTPKSNRTIPIPDGLCTCLQEYMPPLLRAAKGRPALSLHQELSVSRNGVWLQGIGGKTHPGA